MPNAGENILEKKHNLQSYGLLIVTSNTLHTCIHPIHYAVKLLLYVFTFKSLSPNLNSSWLAASGEPHIFGMLINVTVANIIRKRT